MYLKASANRDKIMKYKHIFLTESPQKLHLSRLADTVQKSMDHLQPARIFQERKEKALFLSLKLPLPSDGDISSSTFIASVNRQLQTHHSFSKN